MLEVPFDKTVDLFVDADPGRFRRRIFHPDERQLVDVQTPYIVVSTPLFQHVVDSSNVSGSPGCESAEGFFDDVTLCQFTAYVTQSQGLQRGDIILP